MTPLHHFGQFLRELLVLVPLPVVRVLFVALLLLILIWVVTLPRQEATGDTAHPAWWNDLRVWASLALLIQLAIYALV